MKESHPVFGETEVSQEGWDLDCEKELGAAEHGLSWMSRERATQTSQAAADLTTAHGSLLAFFFWVHGSAVPLHSWRSGMAVGFPRADRTCMGNTLNY